MKARVIKRFRDKFTKKAHNFGTLYEGSKERIEELQSFGWLGETEKEATNAHDEHLNGSIAEVKAKTEGFSVDAFEELLDQEKQSKNRKGVIEYFESMIEIGKSSEPPDGEGE
ncbi:hypothetical protein AB685_29600 [Bacillus sp. LL01]|uniref:hypothetical protein n=1 Tax=Bacillus sp. LL01 TaxID=1665556 RepID=UPI00064D2E7C|nr:hypothetical protein [Bacillus sp. LL01]KMJ54997.1 hypothetical protein AB685_29600 [Bacillus sp. LL01]